MCGFIPIVSGVLGIMGTMAGAKAQANAANAQMQGAVTNMNFDMQQYEIQRRDAFDSTVNEIMKTRMNAIGLNAGVEAALAQDNPGGGRTAELLMRSVKGDELRAIRSSKDNYVRKGNEIDLNKEATLRNTQDQLKAIEKSTSNNNLNTALSLASVGLNAFGRAVEMSGNDYDFWGRKTSVTSSSAKSAGGAVKKAGGYF